MLGNDLKAPEGARKGPKRVGRGHGCHPKTAGRGTKGQNARSGGGKGPGFEGGQTPWYRRLPKYRGFKNRFRTEYRVVSLADLEGFEEGATVTPEALLEKRVIKSLNKPIKVLGNGKLSRKLTVHLHAFTQTARQAIEEAGGKVEVI
ncbi:MAG TPA: 50S ribosomal protein L15 [Candidatus Nitrosotenuis sp.]|jgi:large subunit ribosomal protein L15|nr:50S ribosomal protein L15 [Candidatus Nitrosotenuis sp.]